MGESMEVWKYGSMGVPCPLKLFNHRSNSVGGSESGWEWVNLNRIPRAHPAMKARGNTIELIFGWRFQYS